MEVNCNLKLEDVIEHLPDWVSLYGDSSDCLTNEFDKVAKYIRTGDNTELIESVYDIVSPTETASMISILEDVNSAIQVAFGMSPGNSDDAIEVYENELKELLTGKCDEDPLEDALSGVRDVVAFYNLGYYVHGSHEDEDRLLAEVKDVLKIESSQYDNDLRSVISEAYYDGELLIYFKLNLEEIQENLKTYGRITFESPVVGVINYACGSGDHTVLSGHKLTVKADRARLFLDREFKYDYTLAVCGMVSTWCNSTKLSFEGDVQEQAENTTFDSSLENLLDTEVLYNQVFKAGGCSVGDQDIKRHRDTYYTNNFPCGTKCPHCGTFWVD